MSGTAEVAETVAPPHRARRPGWGGVRDTAGAILGAALGLLPHLMHHISLFAGAVVISGAAGNLALGVVGLLLSVPLLRRLYRRFGSWMAPALAVAAFAAMFSVSALVIGPALSGDDVVAPSSDAPSSDTSDPGTPGSDPEHAEHHDG